MAAAKPIRLLIVWLLLAASSLTAKEQSLPVPFEDQQGRWGLRQPGGRMLIPPRYILFMRVNRFGIAMVLDETGWAAIDTRGQVLLRPFVFDNGPDEFQEGLARFVENNKMGFFNERCQKIIPARFDFALPFENGQARVCQGCRSVKTDDEHSVIQGGQWQVIDRSGQIIPTPPATKDGPSAAKP